MVVHVLMGVPYHLAPMIAKAMITTFSNDTEQVIIIGNNEPFDTSKYEKLFKDNSFKSFYFFNSFWSFLKIVLKFRKSKILLHGTSFRWLVGAKLCGAKCLDWVCWGLHENMEVGNGISNRIKYVVKRILYNRYHRIIVLMNIEKELLNNKYKINSNKILIQPYANEPVKIEDSYYKLMMNSDAKTGVKPVVYLGNSAHYIDSYIKLLEVLRKYSGKIKINCMLHYSINRNSLYCELKEKGEKYFGNDFTLAEEFYDNMSDYINYMNKEDIYICGAETQSGLGAIRTSILLGKKVFLTGNNYKWIKETYNSLIWSIEDMKQMNDINEFAKPISKEEKLNNFMGYYNAMANFENRWHDYFKYC